jgi:hypothetical protein
LIAFYKWRHSKIPLSPLFEEKDTPLATFYIKPNLNVRSLSNMFKTGNNSNREIYLIADAGFGKTIFSKYIAMLWCQAHCKEENDQTYYEKSDLDCLHEFEFLFLVVLRDSYDLCCIDDLIYKLIISNLANAKHFSEDFLQDILNHQKCLVILDGLDEWIHPEKLCYRVPQSIPHRKSRKMCTVLTTTRPWKLGVLNLSSNELGQQVELTKLCSSSAVTFVNKTLARLKSHSDEMSLLNEVSEFNKDISITENLDLTSIPLLLMYTICLWCDGVQIGSSKCNLYVNIVELLLSRMAMKHKGLPQHCETSVNIIPDCLRDHGYCMKHITLLNSLGRLACHTLSSITRENLLVFESSVAETFLSPDDMQLSLLSGL